MATDIQIIAGNLCDVAAHAALQQRVFGHILEENDISLARLGADVFTWKLSPPVGAARIAIAEDKGVFESSCTAFPVTLGTGDVQVRGWHLCDAVTAPEARGRGLFGRILNTLKHSISSNDWLFAFPNEQSRGAFEREGFFALEEVPLWVRPVLRRGGAMPKEIAQVTHFDQAYDEFAVRLSAGRGLTALRTKRYLTWRYLEHPFFDYQCLELRRGNRVDGLAVVNRMEARGRVSMWVMELLAVEPSDEGVLAKAVRALAATTSCDVVLSMSSAKIPGAFRLPSFFLPKKHILMVRSGGSEESKSPGRWDVHTGDWDTF